MSEQPPANGPEALHQQAVKFLQAGQLETARDHCLALTREYPAFADGHGLLGILHAQQGRYTEAVVCFDQALALRPIDSQTLGNRGLALRQLGRHAEALQSYEQAAQYSPRDVAVLQRCANHALAMGRPDRALVQFDRLCALKPEDQAMALQRAVLLLQTGSPAVACDALQALVAQAPTSSNAFYLLGIAQGQQGLHDQAKASFRRVLALQEDHVDALMNLGGALWLSGNYAEAAEHLQRCLDLAPASERVPGYLFNARTRLFDWRDYEKQAQALETAALQQKLADTPFPFLSVSDNPRAQLQLARRASQPFNAIPPLAPRPLVAQPRRLRIAYVSTDFRPHPVSFLMAGVWEHHDRSRFETFAISLNPPDHSPMGQRVRAAFEHFHDLGHLSDEAIVQAMAAMDLHIVVDLMGHTQGSRPGILARRPAPLQINYLGFPGTSGMDCIDYLIADPFVVPEAQADDYSEKILWLPECFQANDDRRVRATTPTRVSQGLPETGLVLCCFNNSYKINPALFDIWCELLKASPASTLWLYAPEPAAHGNLISEAAARGISPSRLVFASTLPYEQHLARLELADLFLDTLPFNAGTTASDALWAGVPVLTCTGQSLAGRMAGSLLNTLGLNELVTPDLKAYRELGLTLIRHPDFLSGVRRKLAMARHYSPLFDTARFTRHLEAGFTAIWQNHTQGQLPTHCEIARQNDPEGAARAHLSGRQAAQALAHGDAETQYRRALTLQPEHLEAANDLGILLINQARFAEATEVFKQALQHWPEQISLLSNLATCLGQIGQHEAMIETYDRCLQLAPDLPYLRGLRFGNCLSICQWQDYAEEQAEILRRALAGEHADVPLSFLSVSDNSQAQLQVAQAYSRWLKLPEPGPRPTPPATQKLRIGYLSADFKSHAVSYLMTGVWEQHDRSQFEVFAFSLSPAEQSPLGNRVRAAFDQFHEVGKLPDAALAELIRSLGIHILVDLLGHTRGARQGLIAQRPAPLQINYLGFPATSGMTAMDYLLADAYLIPPERRSDYSEKIIYLPDCFQANDDQRPRPPATDRKALGLPEEAVVLCSFNQTAKLSPQVFDIWLEVLENSPNTVLWLYAPDPLAQRHLSLRATHRGLAPERLVFAGHADYPGHLARLAAADLLLDTLPFNGGTSASDALWAGLPVLTCSGEAFSARMAASLLLTLGLPELVTTDLAAYRKAALALAASPETLRTLRLKLAKARQISALFDTQRFTRQLEAAYQQIWQAHQQGLPPAHQFLPVQH